MNRLRVQQNLERIVQYLTPHLEFVNAHMVEYISKNHFEKFIPKEIREEIQCVEDVEGAINCFWDHELKLISEFKNLQKFIKTTKSHYLSNLEDQICLSTDKFLDKLEASGLQIEKGLSFKIKDFMTDKKNHEVSIASAVIASMVREDGLILDIGDGKGYLSSRLSLEYNLNVLGIDGNPGNSLGAEKRNEKLKKLWKGLVKREAANVDIPLESLKIEDTSNASYKTASQMIFSDTKLEPLIEANFPGLDFQELSLVGLHTCGNLAANSLKIFVGNEKIRNLCNIGCCYHLLVEEFSKDEFFNDKYLEENREETCFPMSRYLKEKKFALGRNCRMIGAHSLDRVTQKDKEYPNISLFYRALFEVILKDQGVQENFRLGKIKFSNFQDYLRKACKKCDLNLNLTDEEIEKILEKHEIDRKKIGIYYLIRLLFAPIIESVVVLDRYLYLLEQDIDNCFVVKLFDPVISPRCYGIIAMK